MVLSVKTIWRYDNAQASLKTDGYYDLHLSEESDKNGSLMNKNG